MKEDGVNWQELKIGITKTSRRNWELEEAAGVK